MTNDLSTEEKQFDLGATVHVNDKNILTLTFYKYRLKIFLTEGKHYFLR